MEQNRPRGVAAFCILKGIESALLIFYFLIALFFINGFSGTNPSWLIFLLALIGMAILIYVKHLFYLKEYREGARKLTVLFDILFIGLFLFLCFRDSRNSLFEHFITKGPLILHVISLCYFNLTRIKEAFKPDESEPNDGLKEVSIKRWAIGVILFLIVVLSWHSISTDRHLRKHFERSIVDPVPKSVKIINGQCVHWLDAFSSIQFTIDKNDFADIIAGYELAVIDKNKLQELKKYFDSTADLKHYHNGDEGVNRYLYWDEVNSKAYFEYMSY